MIQQVTGLSLIQMVALEFGIAKVTKVARTP